MAKQKEQLAQQEKAVQEQTAQLENLKQENEKAHHQQVRRTTYQSLALLSNDKKIQKQEKQLSELSQKIEDTENLLDEISAVAYDKAVAVVSENAVNDALKANPTSLFCRKHALCRPCAISAGYSFAGKPTGKTTITQRKGSDRPWRSNRTMQRNRRSSIAHPPETGWATTGKSSNRCLQITF